MCSDCMQRSFDAMKNGQIDYSPASEYAGRAFYEYGGSGTGDPEAAKDQEEKRRRRAQALIDIRKIPAPHKIKASLDEYVVGQEYAKKAMSWLFTIIISGWRRTPWMILRLRSPIC